MVWLVRKLFMLRLADGLGSKILNNFWCISIPLFIAGVILYFYRGDGDFKRMFSVEVGIIFVFIAIYFLIPGSLHVTDRRATAHWKIDSGNPLLYDDTEIEHLYGLIGEDIGLKKRLKLYKILFNYRSNYDGDGLSVGKLKEVLEDMKYCLEEYEGNRAVYEEISKLVNKKFEFESEVKAVDCVTKIDIIAGKRSLDYDNWYLPMSKKEKEEHAGFYLLRRIENNKFRVSLVVVARVARQL